MNGPIYETSARKEPQKEDRTCSILNLEGVLSRKDLIVHFLWQGQVCVS